MNRPRVAIMRALVAHWAGVPAVDFARVNSSQGKHHRLRRAGGFRRADRVKLTALCGSTPRYLLYPLGRELTR